MRSGRSVAAAGVTEGRGRNTPGGFRLPWTRKSPTMVAVFCHSEPGGHPANEDVAVVRLLPFEEACYICAVADGQGGRAGSAVAAQVACQVCLEVASRYPLEKLL